MKYLLPLFIALFFSLSNQLAVQAAWARAQAPVSTQGVLATSNNATFGSSVTAGNLVVVYLAWYTNGGTNTAPSSVVDNAAGGSNTYTQEVLKTGTNACTAVYYTVVTHGGAFKVTATYPANAYAPIAIVEYSFTPGTISVSNTNSANNAGSNSPAAGNVTFTAPTALVVGCLGAGAAQGAFTPGGSFSTVATQAQGAGISVGLAAVDNITPASSPQNPSGTWANSVQWSAVGASFQSTGDSSSTVYGGVFSGSPLLPQQ